MTTDTAAAAPFERIVEIAAAGSWGLPQEKTPRITRMKKDFADVVAKGTCLAHYMDAYEDMIRNTATEDAPWYVVPADNEGFTRVVVAAAVVETLASLILRYPKADKAKLKELAAAKQAPRAGEA